MTTLTRTFRPLLALSALLAFSPLVVQAQGPGGMPPPPGMPGPGGPGMHRPGGGGRMHRMIQVLGLTPKQQAQMAPIIAAQRSQMMALFGNPALSEQQKFQKMQAMRQATDSKLNSILTPAQRQKMAAMRAQMHQHPHGPGQ